VKKEAKELANKLNGIDYVEIQRKGFKDAEEKNLLVLFGSSDDLIELRGAIDDEIGCWQSCTIWLDGEGVFQFLIGKVKTTISSSGEIK